MIPSAIAQESPPVLEPLTPVTITLNRYTPTAAFTFEAQAGEMWSITVFAFNLELDPSLALYNPAGTLIAANDNETNASKDSRLEGWIAPESGSYRIEVSRASGANDTFFGTAEVLLLPGYSLALRTPLDTVRVRTNTFRLAEIPEATRQLYVRFTVESEGGQVFGLQLIPAAGDGWRMFFGQGGRIIEALDPAQAGSPPSGSYTLHFDQERVVLVHDGEVLPSEKTFPLPGEGLSVLEIVGAATNTAPLNISRISITIPFYDEALLATAQAPAEPGTRIYTIDRDPFQIMQELGELGYLEAPGAMLMQIPHGMITTTEAGFSTYPLNIGGGVQDFVLGFTSQVRVDTPGVACGMTFRQVDASNFATVLISNDGSVYLLEYVNGELTQVSQAVATPLVRQGRNTANLVLIILKGEGATIFINGTRLAATRFTPQPGTMHLNIVLPEEGYTVCNFDNIWLWSLDELN